MQRLQGWVRYAAQQLPVGPGAKAQQQQQEEDEDSFIYGRVAVHSDDEETGNPAVAVSQLMHSVYEIQYHMRQHRDAVQVSPSFCWQHQQQQ
jgi:hypothetical protein